MKRGGTRVRAWRLWVGLLIAILAPGALADEGSVSVAWPWASAGGDPLPGAGRGFHAWVLAPASDGQGSAVVHLPPRHAAGAISGSGRLARRLTDRPDALAAGRDRLFLIEPLARREGQWRRPVRAMVPTPTPTPGVWGYEPAGRFEVFPHLRRDAALLGAAAAGDTLVLLLDEQPPALVALHANAWHDLGDWPTDLDPSRARAIRLIDAPGELGLLARDEDGRVRAWRGHVHRVAPADAESADDAGPAPAPVRIEWTEDATDVRALGDVFTFAVSAGPGAWASLAPDGRLRVAGPGFDADLGEARTLMGEDDAGLARERGADGWPGGLAIVGSPARVAVVRLDGRESAAGRLRIDERALASGVRMHAGPLLGGSPVTGQDLRTLLVVLVGVLVVVLLMISRGGADSGVAALPPWAAMAEPGRRAVASAIDLVLAGMVSAWSTGSTLGETVLLGGLGKPGGEWPILVMLFAGFCLGTCMERLTGRSLGKAITGAAVISVDPKSRRYGRPPGLAACAVRNAVKWFVPPVAVLAMVDPSRRHRGDVLARAGVVIAIEDADSDEASTPPSEGAPENPDENPDEKPDEPTRDDRAPRGD